MLCDLESFLLLEEPDWSGEWSGLALMPAALTLERSGALGKGFPFNPQISQTTDGQ